MIFTNNPFKTANPQEIERCCLAVVTALHQVLGTGLRSVILKGSAYKGDFIRSWSDIDLHAFVTPEIFHQGELLRPQALAIQRALGSLVAADYGAHSLQMYCLPEDRLPSDWVPPPKGTWKLIFGSSPQCFDVPVDPEVYRAKARKALDGSLRFLLGLPNRIYDHPNQNLPNHVRRMGIDLKALPYLVNAAQGADPVGIWNHSIVDVITQAQTLGVDLTSLISFYNKLLPWPADPERSRHLFELALETADSISLWRKKQTW